MEFEKIHSGNLQFENSEFETSEFEHLEFENSELKNLEFKNSEFEKSEFENSEFRIEKRKGFFWAGVRFKNFFGTYLCRQSTLVLEVQP